MTVEIEIIFGQDVSMSAFIRLHEAIYSNGTLGNITIYPNSDSSKRLICLLLNRLVPKFYEKEVYRILMLQADSITREGRMDSSLTLVDLSFEDNLKQSYFNFRSYAVPGKPPSNLSVDVISPTAVLVRWNNSSPTYYESSLSTTAVRIFYKLRANWTDLDVRDANFTAGYFVLDNLETFSWYNLYVRAVTSRGLGVKSELFVVRTLEEGGS